MSIKTRLNKLESKKESDTFSLIMNLGNGEILNFGVCDKNDIAELKTIISQGDNVLTRLQGECK